MLFELMIFGGVVFWVLFIIFSVIMILCLENDAEPFSMVLVFSVFLVATVLFTDFWVLFSERPVVSTLCAIVGYIVGGVAWAMPKWFFLLLDMRRRLVILRDNFLNAYGIEGTQVPDKLAEEYSNVIYDEHNFRKYGLRYSIKERRVIPPKFSENRDQVLVWMCFWPWNALWTIIENPVKWIFEAVLDALQSLFQKISDILFSGFDDNPLPPIDAEPDVAVSEDPDDSTDSQE
jgi:hypothetical protein